MKVTLDNGMTLVVMENSAAPVVALQVWVKVGSADELPQEAGLAHLHEHMLFKGTAKRPVGEIARTVEGAGGSINAWTSFDQTVYHLVVASRYFDTALDVLADAIQNAAFDPQELQREIEVVLDEIKRTRDIPGRMVAKDLFWNVFQRHPYRYPVLGTPDSLKNFDHQKVLAFYRRWYVPANMVMVVAGDVDAKGAIERVTAAFGPMAKAPPPPRERPQEPEQEGVRVSLNQDNISEGYLNLAFPIPSLLHPDIPALDLLAVILGQGESSRLYSEVKRNEQLVNDISAYAFSPIDPGLLVVNSTFEASKGPRALRAMVEQIERLSHERVPGEELAKAKASLEGDLIYQKETVQGQARKLGYYEVVTGNPEYEEQFYQALGRVTAQDIQRVAKRYLAGHRLTLAALLPQNAPSEALEALAQGPVEALVKDVAKAEASRAQALKVAPKGDVFRTTLPNGTILLVKESHAVPLVAVRAVFLGGLRIENDLDNGVNNLLAEMITKGTKTRSAADVARAVDEMAASLSGFSGRNSFGLRMEVLSQHLPRALDLFNDCLLHPAFDPQRLEEERANVLEELRNREDSLARSTFLRFQKTLYQTHPYRMDVLGEPETVSALDRDRLVEYYRTMYPPSRMVLVVVGDVTTSDILRRLTQVLGDKKASLEPLPPVSREASPPVREAVRIMDKEQAHLVLGFLGTTLDSQDRYALEVLNGVLSSQGGRLFQIVRDRMGLAYHVTSLAIEGLDPGYLAVYMATSPKHLRPGLEAIRAELRRVVTEPVSPEELERVKRYLIGHQAIGLQRIGHQASDLAFNEVYGLGHDEGRHYAERIEGVTAEAVLKAAKTYIDPDGGVLSVTRPSQDGDPPDSPRAIPGEI